MMSFYSRPISALLSPVSIVRATFERFFLLFLTHTYNQFRELEKKEKKKMREFLQQKKRECGMIAGLRDHVVGKLDAIWARMGFEEPEIMDRLRYDFKFSKKKKLFISFWNFTFFLEQR